MADEHARRCPRSPASPGAPPCASPAGEAASGPGPERTGGSCLLDRDLPEGGVQVHPAAALHQPRHQVDDQPG